MSLTKHQSGRDKKKISDSKTVSDNFKQSQRERFGTEEGPDQSDENSNSQPSKDTRGSKRQHLKKQMGQGADFNYRPRPKLAFVDFDLTRARAAFHAPEVDKAIRHAHASCDGFSGMWWSSYQYEPFSWGLSGALRELRKVQHLLPDPSWFSLKTLNPHLHKLVKDENGVINRRNPYLVELPEALTVAELSRWVGAGLILTLESQLWLLIQITSIKAYKFSQIPGLYVVFRDLSKILFQNMYNIWVARFVDEKRLRKIMFLQKYFQEVWNSVNTTELIQSLRGEFVDMLKECEKQGSDSVARAEVINSWWHAVRYTDKAEDNRGLTIKFINNIREHSQLKCLRRSQLLDIMAQWNGSMPLNEADWVQPATKNPQINITCPNALGRIDSLIAVLEKDRLNPHSINKDTKVVTWNVAYKIERRNILLDYELVRHPCINSQGTSVLLDANKTRMKDVKAADLFDRLYPQLNNLCKAYFGEFRNVALIHENTNTASDNNNSAQDWNDMFDEEFEVKKFNFEERKDQPDDAKSMVSIGPELMPLEKPKFRKDLHSKVLKKDKK